MSTIEFKAVTKRYAETPALRDFSCRFPERAITAIVGRSGSGKSTILKLANGLERPTSGEIFAFEMPINYRAIVAHRRQLGYAVQGTGLLPHLSVLENIALPARLVNWSLQRRRTRARELMQLVELPQELAPRYPHALSGGQQQRVGLCRAMMLDPDILLLDEAFGALDPITRADIHKELLRLQALKPRTMILVTHDMREAMKLADQILILEHGEVVQAGTKEEILQRPASAFVEELIHAQLEV